MHLCSKCKVSHDRAGRYCWKCHAVYMKNWRTARRQLVLSPETIRAGEAILEEATSDPELSNSEIATRVFTAMFGPRAKQRKVA